MAKGLTEAFGGGQCRLKVAEERVCRCTLRQRARKEDAKVAAGAPLRPVRAAGQWHPAADAP